MGEVSAKYAPQVVKLLKDPNPSVRSSAARSLSQMREAGAKYAPQVVELLKDLDFSVRYNTVRALGQMLDVGTKYAPQVAELLKDPDPSVRNSAIRVLCQMGEAGAKYTPQVAELLKDPDPFVRNSSARLLGQMGEAGAKYTSQVVELLKDPDRGVRTEAAAALETISKGFDEAILLKCIEAAHVVHHSHRGYPLFTGYIVSSVSNRKLVLLRWLGNRTEKERPVVIRQSDLLRIVRILDSVWSLTEDTPRTREELAKIMTLLAQKGAWKQVDVIWLSSLREKFMKAGFSSQASEVNELLNRIEYFQLIRYAIKLVIAHVFFWLVLIYFYPRFPLVQGLFFWNKWLRRVSGLAYVGILITLIPWLKWSSKNGHRPLSRLPENLFFIFKGGFIPQGRVKSDGVVIGDVIKDLNLRRTPRDKSAI